MHLLNFAKQAFLINYRTLFPVFSLECSCFPSHFYVLFMFVFFLLFYVMTNCVACSVTDGAKDILEATDKKSTPFLDVLIETEQKTVVANPAVQKYLSDVWVSKSIFSFREV